MKSAVLLVIFRRPVTTRRVFEAIRIAQPPKLYIAADGPRPDRPDDDDLCAQTRAITENVDWECDVVRLYREANVGLRVNISEAVDALLEAEGEGIILEDDTLPSNSFFGFCDEMLAKYRHEERVGTVSGYNPALPSPIPSGHHDFTQLPMIWGWATWKRSWTGHRATFEAWPGDDSNFPTSVRGCFGASKRWIDNLEQVRSGELRTVWSYPFFYHCWAHDLLAVMPASSLTVNIGYDDVATNTVAAIPPRHVRSLRLTESEPAREPAREIQTSPRLDEKILADYYKLGLGAVVRQMLAPVRNALWTSRIMRKRWPRGHGSPH